MLFKDEKIVGILLTTPYDKEDAINRTGIITSLIPITDKKLAGENKDQEAYDEIIKESAVYSDRVHFYSNTDYKIEYNSYIYSRSINGAVKNDYYRIIHKDYYDEYKGS